MRRLVSVITFLMLTSLVFAADRITLQVTPRFQSSPGYLRIKLLVPRDAGNRQLCLVVDADTGFYRSSCFEHTGDSARYETLIEYKDVPAGHYTIGAELTYVDEQGRRLTAHPRVQEVCVSGFDLSCSTPVD